MGTSAHPCLQDHQCPLLNSHPCHPPNPEDRSAKACSSTPTSGSSENREQNSSHQKKSWNLPALRNLYVNSDRFAVFLVHHFWSPARSQPKIRRRQRIAGQSQTCQEDGMLFGRGLEVGVHISKPCRREPQPTAYLPPLINIVIEALEKKVWGGDTGGRKWNNLSYYKTKLSKGMAFLRMCFGLSSLWPRLTSTLRGSRTPLCHVA